jgi:hypothetical protein
VKRAKKREDHASLSARPFQLLYTGHYLSLPVCGSIDIPEIDGWEHHPLPVLTEVLEKAYTVEAPSP